MASTSKRACFGSHGVVRLVQNRASASRPRKREDCIRGDGTESKKLSTSNRSWRHSWDLRLQSGFSFLLLSNTCFETTSNLFSTLILTLVDRIRALRHCLRHSNRVSFYKASWMEKSLVKLYRSSCMVQLARIEVTYIRHWTPLTEPQWKWKGKEVALKSQEKV